MDWEQVFVLIIYDLVFYFIGMCWVVVMFQGIVIDIGFKFLRVSIVII